MFVPDTDTLWDPLVVRENEADTSTLSVALLEALWVAVWGRDNDAVCVGVLELEGRLGDRLARPVRVSDAVGLRLAVRWPLRLQVEDAETESVCRIEVLADGESVLLRVPR